MENHQNIPSLLKSINLEKHIKSNDFHILRFEDHTNEIPHKTTLRKCEFYQVYFSKEYNADIIIDNVSFSSNNKTILSFLTPQQTLSVNVKSVENLSNGYMILFNSSFISNTLSDFDLQKKYPFFNLNYSPFYQLNENQNIFKELFSKIYDLFKCFTLDNEEIIKSYLKILLLETKKSLVNETLTNSFISREQQIAFKFESLIRKYSHTRNSLSFYANELNLSVVYLSECVKKATNKTAKMVINDYEILEASTLLIQSEKTIDEIADLLGFSATSNFINFFKKMTNQSPTNFRKTQKPNF